MGKPEEDTRLNELTREQLIKHYKVIRWWLGQPISNTAFDRLLEVMSDLKKELATKK